MCIEEIQWPFVVFANNKRQCYRTHIEYIKNGFCFSLEEEVLFPVDVPCVLGVFANEKVKLMREC